MSFLENILTQLRSSGIVRSQRGPEGGYWLAHPADEVNLAQVIRAVEGPLVGVRGQRPEEIEYAGSAEALQQVWVALRANLRKVLEQVTVADVAGGKLPKEVLALTRAEEAWQARWAGRTPRGRASGAAKTRGAGSRTERIWPSRSSSCWASLAGHLRPDLASVVELQLDPDLEAEVHDPLDQRLGPRALGLSPAAGCRGVGRRRRRCG